MLRVGAPGHKATPGSLVLSRIKRVAGVFVLFAALRVVTLLLEVGGNFTAITGRKTKVAPTSFTAHKRAYLGYSIGVLCLHLSFQPPEQILKPLEPTAQQT